MRGENCGLRCGGPGLTTSWTWLWITPTRLRQPWDSVKTTSLTTSMVWGQAGQVYNTWYFTIPPQVYSWSPDSLHHTRSPQSEGPADSQLSQKIWEIWQSKLHICHSGCHRLPGVFIELEKISVFSVLLFLVFNLPRIVINIIDIRHHHYQLKGFRLFLECFKTNVAIRAGWVWLHQACSLVQRSHQLQPPRPHNQQVGENTERILRQYWHWSSNWTAAPSTLSCTGSCFLSSNPGWWRCWDVTQTVGRPQSQVKSR